MKPDLSRLVDRILCEARWLADSAPDNNDADSKVRILITGRTGVGKTTLQKVLFSEDLEKNGVSRPATNGIAEYDSDSIPLVIAETITDTERDAVRNLKSFLKDNAKAGNNNDAPHLAWVCINSLARRYEVDDADIVRNLSEAGIPVVVVLTKARRFQDDGFEDGSDDDVLRDIVKGASGAFIKDIVLVRAVAEEDEDDDGNIISREPRGLNTLIEATSRSLPEAQRVAFSQALNIRYEAALSLKEQSAKVIIEWATEAAYKAADVPATDTTQLNVPVIQATMLFKIASQYGVNPYATNWKRVSAALSAILLANNVSPPSSKDDSTFVSEVESILESIDNLLAPSRVAEVTRKMGEVYVEVLNALVREAQEKGGTGDISSELAISRLKEVLRQKTQEK